MKPWGAEYQREARIALRKLSIREELAGRPERAIALAESSTWAFDDDGSTFVSLVKEWCHPQDARRILRDVRDLAEGRKVREAARWRVRVWINGPSTNFGPYDSRADAIDDTREIRKGRSYRIVRVTRIRRAPR